MSRDIRITTCCHCGTRAALTLRGSERHELSCSACGAPLSTMKRLRADHADRPRRAKPPKPVPPLSRRKSLWRKALHEAADAIEDLFD